MGILGELWEEKNLLTNLIVVSIIWAVTSFTYYLIIFKLKSLPGNIFVNSAATSIANALGHLAALCLYKSMKVKRVMTFFFVIQVLGSLPICLQFEHGEFYTEIFVPFAVLFVSFGSAGQFCNLYLAHLDLFPSVFASTTMGVCNIVARSVTIFAPLVAEIPYPVPALTFTTLSLIAAILACMVQPKVETYY